MEEAKKKVLFIMHMPPPVHGAAMMGLYIHDSELVKSNFECKYINPTTAKNLEDIQKFSISKIKRIFDLCGCVRSEIKSFMPDVVYFTANAVGAPFYKDYLIMCVIKSTIKKNCPNCKIVIHYHNKGVSSRQEKYIDNKLYNNFFQGIKVILLSQSLYKDVKKYVNMDNVYICPNGIPMTLDYEPNAKRNNETFHILYLSNLLREKGAVALLDALKILKDRGVVFHCNYVGDETDDISAVQFENEIKVRELNDNVSYVGKKYGKDKARYFSDADVFVFPSWYSNETFGLVNLEAMEYKLPIISTDEGGIPDVVMDGENGLIIPVGLRDKNGVAIKAPKAEAIADAVIKLIANPEMRYAMGEDGYLKFIHNFTLYHFERKFVDCLTRICEDQ